MAEELDDVPSIESVVPVERAASTRRPVPARGDQAGWAEEDQGDRKGAGFGTIGLICAAVLIMVAVYFGATVLMK